MAYAKLFDSSRCIGCKACQAACKTWNQDKLEKTRNRGSHENPPDLSANTRTVMRFTETEDPKAVGGIVWTYLKDSCRHCIDAPCKAMGDGFDEGAILQTETGAVVYTDKTAVIEDLQYACPYDVPRQAAPGSPYVKCTLCIDRITNGLQPACVTTCPTDALVFGKREEVLKIAKERLEKIKTKFPDAHLHPDYEDVSFIYLLHQKQEKFAERLVSADHSQKKYASRRDVLNPKKAAKGLSKLFRT
ncbi:MAG TPA: 4Fe-4S dicluster domain-containing protein [bacterium]|nr:4Fe-4S dicluster domain-containing protein [bacterium]